MKEGVGRRGCVQCTPHPSLETPVSRHLLFSGCSCSDPYKQFKVHFTVVHLPYTVAYTNAFSALSSYVLQWRDLLDGIIEQALQDRDPWVVAVAEIMRSFPSTGRLSSDLSDGDRFSDIKDLLKKMGEAGGTTGERIKQAA